MTQPESEALEALDYSEAWIESGLMDDALLAEQYRRFREGGTRKTGRYRAEMLAAWLERAETIEDAQIDSYLALTATDPDAKLAAAAVAQLIQSPRLTLEQLERVARADPKQMRRHEALIRRTYLGRRLEAEVSDELMDRVIDSRDLAIQTKLVRDARLSRKHAEALARRGANPTIRANAMAWFQDKKAWS